METSIEDLSPELMVEVFSRYIETEGHYAFLTNVVPTCKTWRNISSTPSLWKSISLREWNHVLPLHQRGLLRHTRELTVTCGPQTPIDSNSVLTALSHTPDLKSIEILHGSIDGSTLEIIAEHCPNLEHLHMANVKGQNRGKKKVALKEMDLILTKCGPKLKHLSFHSCKIRNNEKLILDIAAKCPSLEVFRWDQFSTVLIDKLAIGCPRLRKLELSACLILTTEEGECFEFKNLTAFKSVLSDFTGWGVKTLENSKDLEYLELYLIDDSFLANIPQILSNKVRVLKVTADSETSNKDLVALKQAVHKWKHSLTYLEINRWQCNFTGLLEPFLDNTLCPKLEFLFIGQAYVDEGFSARLIQKCRNLKVFCSCKERVIRSSKKIKFPSDFGSSPSTRVIRSLNRLISKTRF